MSVRTIRHVTVSRVMMGWAFLVLLVLSGCQKPSTLPFYHFKTASIKPIALKAKEIVWQWEEETDPKIIPFHAPGLSPKEYLESALHHGLSCVEPQSTPLSLQVKSIEWTTRKEKTASSSGFFDPQPGTLARVEYALSVGEPDDHGFQKQAIELRVYEECLIPAQASLQEAQDQIHQTLQNACARIVNLLSVEMARKFSERVID